MIKTLKNNSSFLSIVVISIIPLIFWCLMRPFDTRFSSSATIFRSLGQIPGLLGMVLLSINFILAARFKFLDKLFNGLNKVYVKHHLIGGISFCLLLLHPTFLVIQYLYISLKAAFLFLSSVQDLAMNLGKLGLLAFIVLMVITLYFNFKYQNWKKTHEYLGIVLFLGSLHMLWIPSDISNNPILKYYMIVVALVGAFSYFYRTILGIHKKGLAKYKLEKIVKISENIVELKLLPLTKKIKYLPGQFIFIKFKKDGVLSESHPFSITSRSDDEYLSLGIKTLGDYTSMIYFLNPGITCLIEGPFGVFTFSKATTKKQIWIANGIGITPFLGMAREIDFYKENRNYDIDLFYSVKNDRETAFVDELLEISKRNNNFRFHLHFSDKDSHISANSVSKTSQNVLGSEIFLCGSPKFMGSLREQFIDFGITNNKIHSEEFSL